MEIKIEVAGARLDKALADLTPLSRTVANEQIKEGKVLVNGAVKKAKYTVKEGDIIQYEVPEVEEVSYEAEDLPLDIVYEDQDVVVVNKPQGMVVHPSAGHTSGTLVNALLYHVKDLSGINGELRPGIVHRIDKDTSGLLMVAKNDQAHVALAEELKDKKSLRKYWAIVHGNLPNDRGMIEAPIGRSEKDRKKQAVTAKGKPAVTRFQVLERFGNYTLVELQLETGRCTWPILAIPWLEILLMVLRRHLKDKDSFCMHGHLALPIPVQARPWNLQQKYQRSLRKRWKTFEKDNEDG